MAGNSSQKISNRYRPSLILIDGGERCGLQNYMGKELGWELTQNVADRIDSVLS